MKLITLLKFRSFSRCVAAAAAAVLTSAHAQDISVPNGSFELPSTTFADPRIDLWQKTPKPDWFDETQGSWSQLSGVFLNTAPGASDHIDNIDGNQGAFLFSVPTAGIYQELPDARFETGHTYRATVGLIGGGGNMPEGATVFLALYYRDPSSNQVPVAMTTVTNTKSVFTNTTHFVDFSVTLPPVAATDPWAGKPIGVEIIATPSAELAAGGGYWDLDNVRLVSSLIPNWSFESPATPFADPRIDLWQKTPKPDWFDETQGSWPQLSGVFQNTPAGAPDHIDNMEANQGAFLFSVPTAGIYQDLTNAAFQPGTSYRLTAGLIGGGGNMPEGATLLLALAYHDGTNVVPIAMTTVTNSKTLFPANTHFIDFSTETALVKTNDAWAGKTVSIQIIATTPAELAQGGGYWDIDNVRLTPLSLAPVLAFSRAGSDLRISWNSRAGTGYQLMTSPDLLTWTSAGPVLAGTGSELSTSVSTSSSAHAFFTVVTTAAP